jgi:aldehyde dehydrogenase (NAD+)
MNQAADPARALQLADAFRCPPPPITIRPRYGHFIAESSWTGARKATFATVDPATGRSSPRSPPTDAGEVDAAVRAARAAYDKVWGRSPRW